MKLQVAKGTRDFAPQDKIARNELTKQLTALFERYGYAPLETPLIERMDVLSAKYAGGDEADVMKEVFRLSDQGGRELGLRFDLTVPLARYVGMNKELKMPFKRYQIGTVFRDGPIKAGRYRQFWQYDIDIVGAKSQAADAEIITMVLDVFDTLGIEVEVKVNNRKLLTDLMVSIGVSDEQSEGVIITLDKIDKIGKDAVIAELSEKGVENAEELITILESKDLSAYAEKLSGSKGVAELEELFSLLPEDERIVFTPFLARGLAYYTGTVIEAFSKNKELNFSLAGGGRYDKMIGEYLGGKEQIPAVGLAFGFEPIMDVLKKQGAINEKKSVVDLFIIPIGGVGKEAQELASQFRNSGINTDIDLQGRGLSKNIKYADAYGIPNVLFVGENELKEGKFKLKNLKSGEEKVLSVEEAITELLSS